jgi:hypothetical protein
LLHTPPTSVPEIFAVVTPHDDPASVASMLTELIVTLLGLLPLTVQTGSPIMDKATLHDENRPVPVHESFDVVVMSMYTPDGLCVSAPKVGPLLQEIPPPGGARPWASRVRLEGEPRLW